MPARPRAFAIAGLLALGVTSCGAAADNGVGKLGPAAILAKAKAAADRSTSVHAAGSIDAGGSKTSFDLDLVAGVGGGGQVAEGGLGFALIELAGTAYVRGSPAFYTRFAGPKAAGALEGSWLKASSGTPGFGGLATVTRQRTLVDTALSQAGPLRLVGRGTVDAQKVVRLSSGDGGTFDISATGTPYPVQVTKTGPQGGRIVFDRWNAPVKLTAPGRSVDIATLAPKAAAPGG